MRLVRRARLRRDREGRWVLLWPERGMILNESAAAIVRLCDGTRTVDAIVDELSTPDNRVRVAADVQQFLARLRARRLLEA